MEGQHVLVKMYVQHPMNTNTVETNYSDHGYGDQPLIWTKDWKGAGGGRMEGDVPPGAYNLSSCLTQA